MAIEGLGASYCLSSDLLLYALWRLRHLLQNSLPNLAARRAIYSTWNRFQQHQTVNSLPRNGRPSKISPLKERQIYLFARHNHTWSYLTLRTHVPNHPGKSTIQPILRKYSLRKRRARKRIPLLVDGTRARYRFALHWRRYHVWDRWIPSDECSVQRHSKITGSGTG